MASRERRPNGTYLPVPAARPPEELTPHLDADESAAHADGWTSAFMGIGTKQHDKREHSHYHARRMTYTELALLWEQNDIACKAIEAPAAEAFREGFEIQISSEGEYDDLKEDLEDALEELEIEDNVERAYNTMRAFGGAALMLGVSDSRNLDQPLDLTRNPKVEYLDVYEPIEILPLSLYDDPAKPKYGKVQYFQLNPVQSSTSIPGHTTRAEKSKRRNQNQVVIHESRLIPFQGIQVSRYMRSNSPVNPFWGSPIMPRFIEPMRDFEVGSAGLGLLATDISQPVVSIAGLMNMVGKNEEKFKDRMRAFNMARSMARMIVLDADKEKFDRQTPQLAGIPDIWDRLAQRCAAAIGIPLSVLIGYSPASLGQPDDSEMKLWYNIVRRIQRRELRPPIKKIARMVLRSMRQRKIPPRWDIKWGELERMTVPETVEAQRVQAQTDTLVVKAGMASPDELRKARYKGRYSFHTGVPDNVKAPGFIAPLPAGLLPKGMSAEAAITAIEAGEKPGSPAMAKAGVAGKPGLGAHAVSPYTRRNPKATAGTASPGAGATAAGDGGGARKDASAYTAENELAHQRVKLSRSKTDGEKNLMKQLIALTEQEAAACADGTCMDDCLYDHPDRMDADRPVSMTTFAGLRIGIESPKGSMRAWTDSNGQSGTTEMKLDYGYVMGSEGTDGDSVDCYLGPDESAQWIYVVHQMSIRDDFKSFDEDKAMVGFSSPDAAIAAYKGQYDDPRFFGGMSMLTVDEFKTKVREQVGEQIVAG